MDFRLRACLSSDTFPSMPLIEELGGILTGGGVKPGCCEPTGEYRCSVRADFNLTGTGTYTSTFNCSSVTPCEIRPICCRYRDRVDVFTLYAAPFLLAAIMCRQSLEGWPV